MNDAKHIRAYLAPIRGLPIKAQERMARDAKISERVTYIRGEAGRRANVRDRWIASLREDDIAWVPDLRVLVQPKEDRNGEAPGADFAAALAHICQRRAVVVDHRHKISSTDADWPNHVKWVMNQIPAIHRSQAGMRRAARAAQERRDIGIVTIWQNKPQDELDRVGAIWRDPLYTEMQAITRLPDDLKGKSPATIRRIFGPRRVGDPKAGGRPRKPKTP
jgi:hypothetical protein